jgi:hypothetical protein
MEHPSPTQIGFKALAEPRVKTGSAGAGRRPLFQSNSRRKNDCAKDVTGEYMVYVTTADHRRIYYEYRAGSKLPVLLIYG